MEQLHAVETELDGSRTTGRPHDDDGGIFTRLAVEESSVDVHNLGRSGKGH
jgi:hypothetical protein